MAKQKAYFPPRDWPNAVQVGTHGEPELEARLVQWDDNSLSLILNVGAAYIQVGISPEQCQQLAAAFTAADRAAREVQ